MACLGSLCCFARIFWTRRVSFRSVGSTEDPFVSAARSACILPSRSLSHTQRERERQRVDIAQLRLDLRSVLKAAARQSGSVAMDRISLLFFVAREAQPSATTLSRHQKKDRPPGALCSIRSKSGHMQPNLLAWRGCITRYCTVTEVGSNINGDRTGPSKRAILSRTVSDLRIEDGVLVCVFGRASWSSAIAPPSSVASSRAETFFSLWFLSVAPLSVGLTVRKPSNLNIVSIPPLPSDPHYTSCLSPSSILYVGIGASLSHTPTFSPVHNAIAIVPLS